MLYIPGNLTGHTGPVQFSWRYFKRVMDNAIMAEGEFIDDENDGDCQAEDIDNFAEDIEEDTDEEDNPCQRWIDVKDLRNMTLDELKTLRSENSTGDPDRRVELPITKVN